MKQIGYASVMALVGLSLVALSQPARAQDPAKEAMTNDVKQVLSKYVAAINSGDMALASTMISTKSQVSVIVNGQILRGPHAIASRLNKIMGLQGKYHFTVSNLDVANVNGLALVTGTYTVSLQNSSGAAGSKGAITILLERQGKKDWIIVHMHRSLGSAIVIAQ